MRVKAATKASTNISAWRTGQRSQARASQYVPSGPHADVLALQRSTGNRAVCQLLEAEGGNRPPTGDAHEDVQRSANKRLQPLRVANASAVGGKCACDNHTVAGGECEECTEKKRLGLQTKLKINDPGDSYEREADRIAEQVMAMPAHPAISGTPPRIQRFVGQSAGGAITAPASVNQALSSPGRPLEHTLREDMEQRFGYDFSQVRVHTDARAAESARAIDALAYTVGHEVVLGAGQYAPGTTAGKHLLAHELAHTLQQSQMSGTVSAGDAAYLEAEAERTASRITHGSPVLKFATGSAVRVTNPHDSAGIIQRQPDSAAPKRRKRIKKLTLYKQQHIAEYLLGDDASGDTTVARIPVLKHCEPAPGTYTALGVEGERRWTVMGGVGCSNPTANSIITNDKNEYNKHNIGDTFEGVRVFEFEVRESQADTGGGGPGAGGGGSPQGAATEAAAQEAPRRLRSKQELFEDLPFVPEHIRDFLVASKQDPSKPVPTDADYAILRGIAVKLARAGVSEAELFDLRQKGRMTTDWRAFEQTINVFVDERWAGINERVINLEHLEQATGRLSAAREAGASWADLFQPGLKELFEQYEQYLQLRPFPQLEESAITAGIGITFFARDPDTRLVTADSLGAELERELPRHGFPGGIAEFGRVIHAFKLAFRNETAALASDLLRDSDFIFTRAKDWFFTYRREAERVQASLANLSGPDKHRARELYEKADAAKASATQMKIAAIGTPALMTQAALKEREAQELVNEADKIVRTALPREHAVFGVQNFPHRKLFEAADAEQLRLAIIKFVADHHVNVKQAREKLAEEPDLVYQCDNLLAEAFKRRNMAAGSLPRLIIERHAAQIQRDAAIREFLMALLQIALAVISFVPGPWAIPAQAASAVVGVAETRRSIEEHATKTILHGSGLTSQAPSDWATILQAFGTLADIVGPVLGAVARTGKVGGKTGDAGAAATQSGSQAGKFADNLPSPTAMRGGGQKAEQAVRDAPAPPAAPPRSEVTPTPGAATEAPAPGRQVVAGAPATPAQLSQPVQLAGKSHALSLKRVGDQLQVWLCSNGCGELIAKLEAMIGRLPADHAARTELESLLQRVPREATQIDQDVMQKLASDLEGIQSRHPGVVNPDIPVAPAPSAVDPLADTGGVPEPIPPEQAGEITGRLANPRPVGNLTLTEGQQIIGEYIVTGERRLVGDTLEWDIPGLVHIGGPTLDIRPIREFRDLLIQDAQAAGATTLRIRGAAIRNMNVVRVRRFAEEVGGTAQGYIDKATGLGSNEIIIPVPPRE